jgi:hypothetical protein
LEGNDEGYIGMDFGGSVNDLIKILSRNLPGMAEGN